MKNLFQSINIIIMIFIFLIILSIIFYLPFFMAIPFICIFGLMFNVKDQKQKNIELEIKLKKLN